jgi:hypothetical protein
MERGAAGAPKGTGGEDAGTGRGRQAGAAIRPDTDTGKLERRELAAENPQADVAVSYETRGAISPTTALHPGVGANT